MKTAKHPQLFEKYGPLAVVTGASSGLGRAFAGELADAGFDLLLAARSQSMLASLTTELTQRVGRAQRIDFVSCDLGSQEGREALMARSETQDVGLFVAAAGFGTAGSFVASDLAEEVDLLEVNCKAPLVLTHHYTRQMARRGRGGVILFGSIVGFQGVPRTSNYAASKAYIQSLAEALHHELRPLGVDVMSCAPGPVASGFERRSRMKMGLTDQPAVVARKTLEALGRKATVTPGPVSQILTLLLSTAPRFLRTRIMAKIMGGMTAHLP